MNIVYLSPYSLDGNYGAEINKMMHFLNHDDWAVLTDSDAMFLTPYHGSLIAKIIANNPDAGIITCKSNRVGKDHGQRYNGVISDNPDMRHWRNVAIDLAHKHCDSVTTLDKWVTGVCMIFSKKTWSECPFEEYGILNVDKMFCRKVMESGRSILLAEGLFILHYYRLLEGRNNITHLV